MSQRCVLYLGPADYTLLVGECLGDAFQVVHCEPDADAVEPYLAQVELVIDASMRLAFDAGRIERMRALSLIVTATTGADHIDASALASRDIPLLTLAGQSDFLRNITPAAELSWLLLMACARHLRGAIRHVEQGQWVRESFPGLMLRGRSLGIVGCGRIGGWMSRYAHAFGMRVGGFDPYQKVDASRFDPMTLDDIFGCNDFVSLHVPYNQETRGMIGSQQLARMREGAVLINTSRGAVVNEQDLLSGLHAGRPAFLGVDVLEHEPEIEKSLIWQYAQAHDNVVVTPHIGGFSPDALREVLRFTASRAVQHFAQLEQRE